MEEVSLLLHHDAITGTAKQHVANDYAHRLDQAQKDSSDIYKKELAGILNKETGISINNQLEQCLGN